MPVEGKEKRGEAHARLSCCCSLFVLLTLAAVTLVLVRGIGALSLSTAQVLCEALGVFESKL